MNRFFVSMAIGAALTFGMGTAVSAQDDHKGHDHSGHGHDHGSHGDDHAGHEHDDAEHGHATATPLCPVMGNPVDLSLSMATDDGPVFVCCPGCFKKLKDNPSKYAAKVAEQREALAGRAKIQVKCPVSGNPTDPSNVVEVDGKKFSVCCMGCVGKYKKDPGAYKTALANAYTYQTKCPVMGTEIDPAVSSKLAKGQSIYLCCKGCQKKLFKDPAKYAKAMTAQGYHLDASDMKPGK